MTNADVQTILIKLAALEERLINIQKRLDNGDQQFDELEARIRELEQRMTSVMAWAGFIGAAVPILLTIALRVWG